MPSERKYAERLREQAYKTFSPQLKNLEEDLQELKDSLSNGIYQLERKLEAAGQVELPTTEAVLDEILEDILQQKKKNEQCLALFARDIQQKETQEEILGMLLDYANKFFPRVALFSVRGDRFVGWSSRGYDDESARKISDLSVLRSESAPFEEIMEDSGTLRAPDLSNSDTFNFLQPEGIGESYLVPLHVLERPVALLFADRSEGEPGDSNSISILVALTVLRLENIALKILYAISEDRVEQRQPQSATVTAAAPQAESIPATNPEPQEPPAEAEEFMELEEPVEEFIMAPEKPEEEFIMEPEEPVEEFIMEPEQTSEEAPPPIPSAEPEGVVELEDTPESYAASEETDFQEPAEEFPLQDTEEPVFEIAPNQEDTTSPQIAVSREEEDNLHADAKRFAKLLVSEIKLYNEGQVVEGRNNGDLYLRLKQDIDKSREMYENRVAPIVSQKVDYFHDEIVTILGDNDPSLLGSDYPGPNSPE